MSAGITAAVIEADFTNVGHSVAVILGVLVAAKFRAPVRWTLVSGGMLVSSIGFGFLVLTHHWWSMPIVLGFGVLGGLAVHGTAAFLTARRSPPTSGPASEPDEGSLTGPQPVMTG